jgi:primosomal protein N' (replication factor Y)
MSLIGMGTERVEEELRRFFPSARVLRVDLDTMKSRGAILDTWRAIAHGEADIILGTQMIAKGFHLENVTLVGVVSADFSLFLPDFRSAERTFSLLTQVAGRAGRSPKGGEVVIQTYVPQHYGIVKATEQDFVAFAEKELHIRKILRFPPYYRLLSVTFSGAQHDLTRNLATKFGYILQSSIKGGVSGEVSVLGPAPAPIARIKGRYRWRLLLRGNDQKTMRAMLLQALARYEKLKLSSRVKIVLDMDPLDLL